MRDDDWVPVSASALVIGAMSLVLGAVLNPAEVGASSGDLVRAVDEDGVRWLAMAVMYVFASLALTVGMPSLLTLFERRGRVLGVLGVALFTVGAVGTCGYAMLMVFFRALVVTDAVQVGAMDRVGDDRGIKLFLEGWFGAFYAGVLVLAVALLVARTVPVWVPVLLALFVGLAPFVSHLGRVGSAAQLMALAVALTGVAMAAVAVERRPARIRQPAF